MERLTSEYYIKQAIDLALQAQSEFDEVPVGALIVKEGVIISSAYNLRETQKSCTAHAEIIAIEKACKALGSWRLQDCQMYVTLEPCPMCAGAIVQSRMKSLYFGAYDPKSGACQSLYNLTQDSRLNHQVETIGGILESQCSEILTQFFQKKRQQNLAGASL